MKIVIIEDEKPSARDLRDTLLRCDATVQVSTLLHSLEEARAYFETQPDDDLIFSDIQLGDGLSLELFRTGAVTIPIVFCTAYDQYLADAFQASGIDYILKPFTEESVARALNKYRQLGAQFRRNEPPAFEELLRRLQAPAPPRQQSVIIRVRDRIIPLSAEEIAVLYVDGGGTFAHTFSGQKHLLSDTLEALELAFGPSFFRVSRQFLVNRKAVREASQHFHRKLQVHLNIPFAETILVGKLKITPFLSWLTSQ